MIPNRKTPNPGFRFRDIYMAYNETPLRKAIVMLFDRRALQVKMVKIDETPITPEDIPVNLYQDPELMNTIAKDLIKNTTITVAAAVGGYKILSTICNIAEIAAKAKF